MYLVDYCCMYFLPDYLSLLENKKFSCIKMLSYIVRQHFFEVGQKCVLINKEYRRIFYNNQ